MNSKTFNVGSLGELREFAAGIAAGLRGGEALGLIGPLGAGKTTFTQMLAEALGVERAVKSPTFVLMQVHATGRHAMERGVAQLCHVDAYRVESEAELFGIGLEEYLSDPQTVTVVEWADRAPSLAEHPRYKELRFSFGVGEARRIATFVRPATG
jgi:tRNA threonylcarbamoyladenosine biosynthesis protein TsaE